MRTKLLLAALIVAACNGGTGEPSGPPPTAPPSPPLNGIPNLIEVSTPTYNAVVCSDGQVTVTGRARGYWYFEATFPIEIRDVHGQPLGQHYAQAQGDWMTNDFVPFKGVLKFREPQGLTGTIVFHKDNPSGLPEHDRSYEMPVRFQHEGC